ncbi:MAG: FAD-binding oxidoreductase [Hormoscilla sp.]
MNPIASQLETIVSPAAVVSFSQMEVPQQQQFQRAIAPATARPKCIVYPSTPEELGAVLQLAKSQSWRVLPCGSGSKIDWGGLVHPVDIIVSTAGLNQAIEHAVDDLTLTVAAGMKFVQIEEMLAGHNQFLALDPAYPENATIGGIVATADTGSWRQRYGGVRDRLIGISFVRSDGKIVKAGGRVVKNVAGYDLMKLLTGSYGTLGVISQVTLRLYPLPEASGTVVLTGSTPAIDQATRTLLNSALTPTAADLTCDSEGIKLIARFQSMAQSVKQQSERLLEVGQALGLEGSLYSDTDEVNLWKGLRKPIWESSATVPIICKIGVRPTAAVEALTFCQKMPATSIAGVIHARTGLGLLRSEALRSTQLLEMRSHLASKGGFLTVLSAPVEFKQKIDVWGYKGNAIEIMRGIKQQFDPKNILSPHRFVGGM